MTAETFMTLRLVPFAAAHFATLVRWFSSEEEVVQWGGPGVSFPLDASQLDVMLGETRARPPGRLAWMAEGRDRMVGHAQLGLDWRNGNALLARVAVAPDERGRGLAAAMLRQVIGCGFALPGFERIELNVYSFNTPAIRLYERLGFVREGVRRSSTRVGNNRWDTVIMGLLRSERRC